MDILFKDIPIISKFRIACYLKIEQRIIDPFSNLNYENLFLKISKFMNCNLKLTTHNKNKKYYIIQATSKISIKKILDYFNEFNLYSSKYLDYLDWNEATKALLNNNAYLSENKIKRLEHKNNMNNKRTIFNWDHLKNLY